MPKYNFLPGPQPPGILAPALAGAPPALARAVFWSHTHDEDKDHDTGLYVEVAKSDKTTILAGLYNGEAQGQYGYADDENHWVDLGITDHWPKDQCQGFVYRVGIQAKSGPFGFLAGSQKVNGIPVGWTTGGNDDWRYDGGVTLYFTDGTSLQKKIDGQELNSRGGVLTWTDWA